MSMFIIFIDSRLNIIDKNNEHGHKDNSYLTKRRVGDFVKDVAV
jgi:hypothetical protein